MLLTKGHAAVRTRVRIGAAPDRHQCNDAGLVRFDPLLGTTSPIAVDLRKIAAQRRIVARVIEQQRQDSTVFGSDFQYRQVMARGCFGNGAEAHPFPFLQHPAVRRKIDAPACQARDAPVPGTPTPGSLPLPNHWSIVPRSEPAVRVRHLAALASLSNRVRNGCASCTTQSVPEPT